MTMYLQCFTVKELTDQNHNIVSIPSLQLQLPGGSGGVGKAILMMRSKIVDCGLPHLPMLACLEDT